MAVMLDEISLIFTGEKHAVCLGCGVQSAQNAAKLKITSAKMPEISQD